MPESTRRPVFTDYSDEAWQTSFFRHMLIALLAGSVASGPAILRVGLGGSWPGHLIPVAVVVAAVAVATTTQLGRPSWRDRRGAAFRLGELLLLLLVGRILVWAFVEGFPTGPVLRDWVLHPGLFFTGEYVFAVVVWFLVWLLAIAMTSDFLELAIQPDEVAARDSHAWGDSRSQWRVAKPMGRSDQLQVFALRWIGIGILLVVCAGVTRVDVSANEEGIVQWGLRGLGLRPEVVACLVCYFLTGLLLMSHGRLAVLRGRWFNQEVEIHGTLIRRWHAYSLVFIGLIAVAALLLPLGSTSWFSGAVEWLIAFAFRVVLFIGFLIGLLASLLFSLFARLFGSSSQPPPEQVLQAAPQAIPSQADVTTQLPPWLGGAVLWLVVGVVATFLLINFLKTTGLLQSKLGARGVRWLLWWRARRARLSAIVRTRLSNARRRIRRAQRRARRPQEPGKVKAGVLLPRDQVRRFYLAAVKEASEEGVVRPSHETPLEYAEDLAEAWPESGEDVRELTEAFIDARYSQRDIGKNEVTGAESAWRRLVRALRGGKRDGI